MHFFFGCHVNDVILTFPVLLLSLSVKKLGCFYLKHQSTQSYIHEFNNSYKKCN